MSFAKWFDTEVELQKLRPTPAKVAKPAKVENLGGAELQLKPLVKTQKSEDPPPKPPKPPKVESEGDANFSHFSHFSRGEGPDLQNSPHCSPEVSSPDKNTLATLATLAGGQVQNRIFHDDSREETDQSQEANTWLCPHCGNPASIDDVDWSSDSKRQLTFWSCDPCQVVAVTPSDIKEPPTGWVRKIEQ